MKKFKNKKSGSIFTLLINNYLFFTIIVVILALAINAASEFLFYKHYNIPRGLNDKTKQYLIDEKYNKIELKKILGVNGSIEVLDEEYSIVASLGNITEKNEYTAAEISCIPDYQNNSTYVKISDFTNELGESYKVIMAELYDYNKEGDYSEKQQKWFQVIDANLNVVTQGGDIPTNIKHYTEEELKYINGIYDSEFFIEKFQYVNNLGEKRIAVIKYKDITNPSIYESMSRFNIISLGLFGATYILCIVLFVILLRRKFYEPLEKLNGAMTILAEGSTDEAINYRGPKEFVDICDNFNIMVSKLKRSEADRAYLMEEKERMMADISHDLKTPITSIQGYAKALADDVIPEDQQKKYINIIYNKSKRLTELINIFHEYSKLEHPNFNLQMEKVDLSEYLRAYIALKYEDILEGGFSIEVDIPEEEIYTDIDKVQFQRVLDNILGNSIKHNPKGTKIFVSLKGYSRKYEIIIADNGIGIPKEIAKNIFEPFIVGDESRNSSQGSGLGLAISKTIINLHGGSIKLISNEDLAYTTIFKIVNNIK